jgi:sulfonate transport system ATP-binding protein
MNRSSPAVQLRDRRSGRDRPALSPIEPELGRELADRPGPATNGQTVVIEKLSKSFGGRRVLSDIDLTIPPGHFLAIVGRSGRGSRRCCA